MPFQIPFTAAHKNWPVLEQAVFLKHVLQSHETTEPTEWLQSPQIMQYNALSLANLHWTLKEDINDWGKKIEKTLQLESVRQEGI